jgi:hypothetical protein
VRGAASNCCIERFVPGDCKPLESADAASFACALNGLTRGSVQARRCTPPQQRMTETLYPSAEELGQLCTLLNS